MEERLLKREGGRGSVEASSSVKVLQEKEPEHLQKALTQSDWSCLAWNDGGSKESFDSNACGLQSKDRKRQLDNDGEDVNERKSVMAKTEKVEAFTFSFL